MQRGLIFLALFATTLFASDSYWLKLLHFRDGQSQIDDSHFFLSPIGNVNPQAELNATINALKQNDNNISCRYPARTAYLFEAYADRLKGVKYRECPALQKLLKEIEPKSVTLIFPTAHINSPASMFGHTFLRINGNEKSPLMANAINYAANSDEKNGLFFAYYGLTGGYQGRYSALPYYKKIKEYSNLESRDIWEYDLDLTPQEIRRMLLHLYEIKDYYSDYYFFTRNCSYNLLWLLEVARPSLDLVGQFSYKAIPIDTIKVISRAGLIIKRHFRPSSDRKIRALLEASKHATGRIKEAYQAELAVKKLKLLRKAKKIDAKNYTKKLIALLQKRSRLPKTPSIKIPNPTDPLRSHPSTRVDLAIGDQGVELGYKAAFHDIYDLDRGFKEGAYIDFFHLNLLYKRDRRLRLNYFDFVKIISYAPIDAIFFQPSWGVEVGFEHFRGKDHFKLKGEVGLSYKVGRWLIYTTALPSLHLRAGALWGIGAKVGAMANFEEMKVGASIAHEWYDKGFWAYHGEIFTTMQLTDSFALNLKLEDDSIDKNAQVRLFYYF